MTTLDASGPLSGTSEDKGSLLRYRRQLLEEGRQIDQDLKPLQAEICEEESKHRQRILSVQRLYKQRQRRLRQRLRRMALTQLRKQWSSYQDYKLDLAERGRKTAAEVEAARQAVLIPTTKATEALLQRRLAVSSELARVKTRIAAMQHQEELRRLSTPPSIPPSLSSGNHRQLQLRRLVAGTVAVTLLVGIGGTVWSHLPSGHHSASSASVIKGVLQPSDQVLPSNQPTEANTPAPQAKATLSARPTAKPKSTLSAAKQQTTQALAKSTSSARDEAIAKFNAVDNQMQSWVPTTVKFWAADVQKVAADSRAVSIVDGKKVNILQGVLTDDGQWHNGREDLLYTMMMLSGGNPASGPIALDGATSKQLAAETGVNPLLVSDPHLVSYDNLLFAGRHLNDIAGGILTNACINKLISANAAPSTYLDDRIIAAWYGQAYEDGCRQIVSTTGQIPGKQLLALINLYQDWRKPTSAQWQELQSEAPMKQLLQQAKAAEAAFKPLTTP